MNRQTNAKQTKARIQPKRNKQQAESAEKSYATRRKKIHVWSQIYGVLYQKTVLYWLYCTHGDHIWPRRHDMQRNFTTLSLCQRLNTRSKIKVLHTTQDIKVSIKSTLCENIPVPLLHYTRRSDRFANLVSLRCWNWFHHVVVTHRNQKSSLWIFKSIESFRLGINTKKYSWDGLSAYL